MAYTSNTAPQAVSVAKSYSYWPHWMCLAAVRRYLTPNTSSPYNNYLSDATAAWRYAQRKHTTGVPPAGAPVYWRWVNPYDGRDYGHIALSLGNGYVRSTDYPAFGRVGTVGLWALTSLWGLTYRGWSEDYAGLTIPGLMSSTAYSPTPTISTTTGGLSMSDVSKILDAIAAIPERVGYGQVGATGKSVDTYLLAINARLANLEKSVGEIVGGEQVGTTGKSLDTYLLAINTRLANLEKAIDALPKA